MSDLQMRLALIEEKAEAIKKRHSLDGGIPDGSSDMASLAYLVGYLAAIVKKHLEKGEQ
jgi:hypothetical protein